MCSRKSLRFLPQPLSTSVLLQDALMIGWTGWQLVRAAAR